MKKHLQSLFDQKHLLLTFSLFASAVVFISGAAIAGINDNLPGIGMLLTGIILLYFTVLHPWQKAEYYAILVGICVMILILEWLGIHLFVKMKMEQYLNEAVAMILAFFICMPGIITGIIGVLICVFRKKIRS